MIENVNGVKKVDVFNDIVSRLEDSKKAKVSDDVVNGMKNYYSNKQNYRDRVNLLAANLNGVKPIDNLVNNVIYLSNFMEKGIAIKTSIMSFKQIWIEYRLIFNENSVKKEEVPLYSAPVSQVNMDFGIQNNNQTYSNQIDQFAKFEAPDVDANFGLKSNNNQKIDNPNLPVFDFNSSQFVSADNSPKIEENKDLSSDNFEYPDYNKNNSSLDIPNFEFNIPSNDDINLNNSKETSLLDSFDKSNSNNNELKFDVPFNSSNNLEFENVSVSSINDVKLDENYKKLYSKVINLSKYIEQFNKRKFELDRQISSLEDKKRNLSNELHELEMAKKEFSRYKIEEEKKINDMKKEVNSKVVSLQNLIDNLDSILGKIN